MNEKVQEVLGKLKEILILKPVLTKEDMNHITEYVLTVSLNGHERELLAMLFLLKDEYWDELAEESKEGNRE